MTTSALWDVPESCGCVLSRMEGHRCEVPFGDEIRQDHPTEGKCSMTATTDGTAPTLPGLAEATGDGFGPSLSERPRTRLRTPYVPVSITCGGCDNVWTGASKCHCSACHRLFSGIGMFDRHRVNGQCVDPATIINSKTDQFVMRFAGDTWCNAAEFVGRAAVFPRDAA